MNFAKTLEIFLPFSFFFAPGVNANLCLVQMKQLKVEIPYLENLYKSFYDSY